MYALAATDEFNRWFASLKDSTTRARLLKRLRKVAGGSLGDHASVGNNVWELREFFGPGWRMYYTHDGNTLILMLGGGDKSSQRRDIERARRLAKEMLSYDRKDSRNPPL